MITQIEAKVIRDFDINPVLAVSPEDLVNFCMNTLNLASWTEERFMLFCFDAGYLITHVTEIDRGTLTECVAWPRRILQGVFLSNSDKVVTVHNHPSDSRFNPALKHFSDNDIRAAKMITSLGIVTGEFNVLDHMVITANGDWMSLGETYPNLAIQVSADLNDANPYLPIARLANPDIKPELKKPHTDLKFLKKLIHDFQDSR
jgi:DNA repair protein RadC